MSKINYSQIFQPLTNLFTQAQLNTILLAYLPSKLEFYLTGIIAVDMFITSVVACAISTSIPALFQFISVTGTPWGNKKTITIQIEHCTQGKYGYSYTSVFYEALSWLISQQTKKLNDESNEASVDAMSEFLNEIVRSYLEIQKKSKVRSRYERCEDYWNFVQTLSSSRGLESVALDESHEKLLKKELETFVNDKSFYERIGMPYRRGILLYGKPGTGKTSLINAISSQLSRDIYYLNLKNIKDDTELSAAFSDVPGNQIIVLEDVDTQSKVLHRRTNDSVSSNFSLSSLVESSDKKDGKTDGKPDDNKAKIDKFADFSLSTFLGCLDGHILAEGNIIIMTTNHVEHLDPACIRPGRMDVQLNLGYCTHYQIKKMYRSVIENPEAEFPQDILEKIPEKLLPPCEVMMTMILYRSEIDLIPQKIYELVAKYIDVKSEDAASSNLTEMNETKSEEVKDENKDKKEDVKSENEEVKDENKDKKEDVKDEIKKEDVNKIKEGVKDENKEENKEDKIGEEIINEANINNLNEEDSDSNTDVELEVENDKIKYFETIETLTVTPQIA
ncbi:20880_t:CDS:2 [Rhizophagus irregularis]|nr:20880_t:CDS:2 [Rhizophagus irregularis]